MSKNEVAKREEGEVSNYSDNDNPYAQAASEMGGDTGVYAKFNGKDGQFVYGEDDEVIFGEADKDDGIVVRMALNMDEFDRGWMCWVDEEVVKEILRGVTEGPEIREEDLPTDWDGEMGKDDGWVKCAQIPMRDLETGEQFLFKAASNGSYRALGKFLKAFSKQYKKHPDEIPIVELDMESYEHKKKQYGKIFNPIFNLVDFMTVEDLDALVSDDGEGYEPEEEKVEEKAKAKPKAKAKAKPKADPKEEEEAAEPAEDEKPKTRRRKRREF